VLRADIAPRCAHGRAAALRAWTPNRAARINAPTPASACLHRFEASAWNWWKVEITCVWSARIIVVAEGDIFASVRVEGVIRLIIVFAVMAASPVLRSEPQEPATRVPASRSVDVHQAARRSLHRRGIVRRR